MKWFGGILLNAILFVFLSWLIPNFNVSNIGAAILASIVLAIVNMIVRPILVILTLPATILTLGLFLFIVNALMLLLTHQIMGDAFIVGNFGTAIIVAFLMTILNTMLNSTILKPHR